MIKNSIYFAPECELLELSPEGVIAASPDSSGVETSNPFGNNTEESWN